MPHRKATHPTRYAEWIEALKEPLTYGNALYMSGGKLKESDFADALFRKIADYVVDTFNAQAEWVRKAAPEDAAFAIIRFNAEFRKLFFYRSLPFIKEKHAKELTRSIADAAQALTVFITESFGETDTEILFARNELRRRIRTETA